MSDEKIYQEPSEVDAEEGVVSVKGPDDVDVRMTADAADETSERLLHGALKARGQKLFAKARSGEPPEIETSE